MGNGILRNRDVMVVESKKIQGNYYLKRSTYLLDELDEGEKGQSLEKFQKKYYIRW